MPLTLHISNQSGEAFRGHVVVKAAMERALIAEGVKLADVGVALVDDETMQRTNREHLVHDYTTDVLTFPYGTEDGVLIGEIVISLPVARRQATEYGVSVVNEVSRLAVHGVLHLCGYDDATDAERSSMSKMEDRYLGVEA